MIQIYERNEMKHIYMKLTRIYKKNNRDIVELNFYAIKKSIETVKCKMKAILLEWLQLVSEKRCGSYVNQYEHFRMIPP